MDYTTLMNTQDANPLHNELRRAIATAAPFERDDIEDNWDIFMHQVLDTRAQRFKMKPLDGPYTLALVSIDCAAANTRGWMQRDDKHADVAGLQQIEVYAQSHYREAERRDAALFDFLKNGAWSYETVCPNCSEDILELFVERTMKHARQMLYDEPDKLVNDIFYRAANRAATEIHRNAPDAGVKTDMEFVMQSTESQIQLFQSVPLDPYEFELPEASEEER